MSERRNRILLDMVRFMMFFTDLSLLFWGYVLEIVVFILNRVSFKFVETISYELWFGKKFKQLFLKVWSCDVYVKKF